MGGNWSQHKTDEFNRLAALGVPATELAAAIGATRRGVLYKAQMDGIEIVTHTPEELAAIKARKKARVRSKDTRKRVRNRSKVKMPPPAETISRTSPEYRRRWIGIAPVMTKGQLRAELAEAVRNTAAMGVR